MGRPCKTKQAAEQGRSFGWHGIALAAPEGWELGAYGGDRKAGYAYLDDGLQVRLRVRWNQGPPRAPDLTRIVRKYRRTVRKDAKCPIHFEELPNKWFPKGFRRDRSAAAFQWTGDQTTIGAAWYCHGCGRVVLLEVTMGPEGEDARQARGIVASARDHSADGLDLWSVYGFAFMVPETYNLRETALQSGRLQFVLRKSRRAWIRVERWGLADRVLRRAPLHKWPEELLKSARVSRWSALSVTERDRGGLPGFRFEGKGVPGGLMNLVGPPVPLAGLVWHDPDKNKVIGVVVSGEEGGDLLDTVAATLEYA